MSTVLIAGIDSVVGSNLAASLSDQFRIVGLSSSTPVAVPGCEGGICPGYESGDIQDWLASTNPDWVVYCGEAARGTWPEADLHHSYASDGKALLRWAEAAGEFGCRMTLISSDAVFTGPWMFHDEQSTCLCQSVQATALRSAEKSVLQLCPDSLVVRTNVYGWAGQSVGGCWIEQMLSALDSRTAGPFDYHRFGTPILATDLASILERAWQAELDGVYHIAGAERVTPNQFVEQMACEFGLPSPQPVDGNCLEERPTGFARGETSLCANKIRRALGVSMPTLAEGICRLREQKHSGYYERLQAANLPAFEKVA